jgi:hypothetical protein
MIMLNMSFLRRVLKDEKGQSLVILAFGMFGLLGVSGISMDLVNAYAARQALQASTNAAALSGAVYLSNSYLDTASALAAVTQYSSLPGSLNAVQNLTNVQLNPAPSFPCLTTVSAMGVPCLGAGAGYNTMIVTQTADVKTWFATLFGIPVFHLKAVAYATPGGAPAPLNLAIILDTTGSMATNIASGSGLGSSDPTCVGHSELACALNGVGIMLNSIGTSPDSSANAPVALFTFPNIAASNVSEDLNCTGTPPAMSNSTPTSGSSYGPTGSNPTYMIVPFTTSYSTIMEAVGVVNSSGTTTTAGCLKATSGGAPAGTYLAGAIVAAQSALVAQNVVHPVAVGQSVMVILTDDNVNGSDQYQNVDAALTMMATTSTTWDNPDSSGHVDYPSGVGGCGQAVQMAQAARASTLQTSIFVIDFGSSIVGNWNPSGSTINSGNMVNIINASNCPSDQDGFFNTFKKTVGTSIGHGTLQNPNPPAAPPNLSYTPNISPCTAAQDLATPNTAKIVYFYSDTQGATSGACPSASTLGSLKQIFAAIVGELPHKPRLIPVGTT